MIAERNHEYLAAGLRQQMESLAHMIEEVQLEQLNEEAVEWRLRAVEIKPSGSVKPLNSDRC